MKLEDSIQVDANVRLYQRTLPKVLALPEIVNRDETIDTRHFRYHPLYISRAETLTGIFRASRKKVERIAATLGFSILVHEYHERETECRNLLNQIGTTREAGVAEELEELGIRVFPYRIKSEPNQYRPGDVYKRKREARPELPIDSIWTPMQNMANAFGITVSDVWHISLAKAYLTDPDLPPSFRERFQADCKNFDEAVSKRLEFIRGRMPT